MKNVDLIVKNAAQLVTCSSNGRIKKGREMLNLGIIEDGAIALSGGMFVGVGSTVEILAAYKSENTIDAGGKVVCPGFVDPHTHIVFGGNRLNEFELRIKGASYLEIMEAGGGIVSTVSQTRDATFEELVNSARKRLDVMLESGTTTVEIKTGYGLDLETELKMLEVIAELDKTHAVDIIPTFLAAHAIPEQWKGKENEFTELICEEMLPAAWEWYQNSHFSGKKLATDDTEKTERKEPEMDEAGGSGEKKTERIHTGNLGEGSKFSVFSSAKIKPFFIDVFCEQGAFNLKQSKQVIETAKNFGFGIKAHVDEFTNLGCAGYAIEQGATSIDHLDATSDQEIEELAASDTLGIITPTVNFNLGSKEFANPRKMIDEGCAIALSTDYNPGSAPCPSQPLAMAIACRFQKLLPSEAFNAITINSAYALGLGESRGSIEVGKQADLLLLDTDDYRHVAYEFGRNFVKKILKNGIDIAY